MPEKSIIKDIVSNTNIDDMDDEEMTIGLCFDDDKAYYLIDRGEVPKRFDSADWVLDTLREQEQKREREDKIRGTTKRILKKHSSGGGGVQVVSGGARVAAVRLLDKKSSGSSSGMSPLKN